MSPSLAAVVGALGEGLLVQDATGRVVLANAALDELTGLPFRSDPARAAASLADQLRDEGGMPVTLADLPSIEVAFTGRPVRSRLFRLGDGADPTWLRANAVPLHEDDRFVGTVTTVTDVTVEHELALALHDAEEQQRSSFDHAPIGMAVVTIDGRVRDANPALATLLGRDLADLRGTDLADLAAPTFRATGRQRRAALAAGQGDHVAADERWLRGDGRTIEVATHESVLRDPDGSARSLLVQVVDLTDRKRLETELAHAATHDPLTGLPNRRLVLDRLSVALAGARRTGTAVAVLFCDLDRFKTVNDHHGHAVGDLLLREVAGRLQRVGRGIDTVGRIGGDEFVVLAPGVRDLDGAATIADRLVAAVQQPVELHGTTLHPAVSVGYHLADGSETAADAIGGADGRMYARKRSRRAGDAARVARRAGTALPDPATAETWPELGRERTVRFPTAP